MMRFAVAILFLIMAAVPTFFWIGPLAEARLYPVLTIKAIDVRTEKAAVNGQNKSLLYFKTDVDKYRPCRLDVFAFRWLFNHSVEVTPVFVRETGLAFQPQSVVTTGRFTSRELWTEIPPVAYNFKHVRFRGTLYFWCHALWPLTYDFEIPITIPPATP